MAISENCYNFIVSKYKVLQTIIAMFTESKVTEIFYLADEFCKFLMQNKKNQCCQLHKMAKSTVANLTG